MRLLLDTSALYQQGNDRGIGRYVSMLRSAVHQMPTVDVEEYQGWHVPESRWSDWWGVVDRVRSVRRHRGFYHASSVYHLAPPLLRRSIVSVLDLIPLELPEHRQTGIKARTFFPLARRCRGVAVLSQHTAHRLHTVLGVSEDRVVVCPLPVGLSGGGCDAVDGCLVGDLPDVFVSSVIDLRSIDPRKRAPWLLKAAARLRDASIPVVLIGNGTDAVRDENAIGMGRLCDPHLRELLRRSLCFLYTSAYEGQGLPPQEALSVGTPVVALRNSSLPEMLGPGALWVEEPVDRSLSAASLLVDREGRVDRLVGEVLRLAQDRALRDTIGQAGREFVGKFTQEGFTETMQAFYNRVCDA